MSAKTSILPVVLLLAAHAAFSQNASDPAEQGKKLMNENKYNAAITSLSKAAETAKKNDDVYASLAKAYLLSGKESSALEAAQNALKINSKNVTALSITGYYDAAHNDEKKGLAQLDKAIAMNPGYCDSYFFKATYYKSKGDYFVNQGREPQSYENYFNDAIQWFSKDLQCDSANTNALFARGISYYRLKKYPEAIADMASLVAIDPSNIDAFILMAKAHDDNGETPQALEVIKKALAIIPGDPTALSNQAAFYKHQQNKYSEATKGLWAAVQANDSAAVMDNIARKADVHALFDDNNTRSNTAVQKAAQQGNYELVKALIAAGADVNMVNSKKFSALSYAVAPGKDNVKLVELLLQNKADIKQTDADGMTAFSRACFSKNIEAAILLLKAGSDVNKKDGVRRTPLMGAIKSGSPKLIKLLLAAGADVNATSMYGETPLFYALNAGPEFLEVTYLLVKNGAVVTDYITGYAGGKGFTELLPFVDMLNTQALTVATRRLFDPILTSDNAALKKALADNPGTPKLILNYMLMASAPLKDKSLFETLAAAGADRNYQLKGIAAQSLVSVPVTEENRHLVAQVWEDPDKPAGKPAVKAVAANTSKKTAK